MKRYFNKIIIFFTILVIIVGGGFLLSNFLRAQEQTPLPNFDIKSEKGGSANLIKYFFFKATNGKDIIGIRVYKNSDFLSPLQWYQKNVPNPGNPSLIKVDGYDGLRDGRSVYISALYINETKFNARTSNTLLQSYLDNYIYLISYNEGASSETIEIFNRMVKNWKFNTNITLVENQLQQIKNDFKRGADIKNIKSLLEKYKQTHGYYPKLKAGTYVANHTVSVWPSWQLELGRELGSFLPIDPKNKFGQCKNPNDLKYDPLTCWDNTAKIYAGRITDKILYPVDSSFVYTYSSLSDGQDYYFGFETELGKICSITKCFLDDICKEVGACHTDAIKKQYCQLGNWVNHCGNGTIQCDEICDGNTQNYCDIKYGDKNWYEEKLQSCKDDCSGWEILTYAQEDCGGYCGDKIEQKEFSEKCDRNNSLAATQAIDIDHQYKCEKCKITGGWCGDNLIQSEFEQCEKDGTGTSEQDQYKCIDCKWTNGYCGDKIEQKEFSEKCDRNNSLAATQAIDIDHQYKCEKCKITGGWCGDGIIQSNYNEQCDDGNNNERPDRCDNSCKIKNQIPQVILEESKTVRKDGQLVTINGSASDPDGDSLTYLWEIIKKPQGSIVLLSLNNTLNINFIPDKVGEYELKLTAKDNFGGDGSKLIKIIAQTYCGDKIIQNFNDEKVAEECDGQNGLEGWRCLGGETLSCGGDCKRMCSQTQKPISCGVGTANIKGKVIYVWENIGIKDAKVELKDSTDYLIAETMTDSNGNYFFNNISINKGISNSGCGYKIIISKTGYSEGDSGLFSFDSNTTKDFALTGGKLAGAATVVLIWEKHLDAPFDLDSYVKFGNVYVGGLNTTNSGVILDTDTCHSCSSYPIEQKNCSGVGCTDARPEKISIAFLTEGKTYKYFVDNFSGYKTGGNKTFNTAKVEIYNGNGIKVKEYIPPSKTEQKQYWTVFELDDKGMITDINTLDTNKP